MCVRRERNVPNYHRIGKAYLGTYFVFFCCLFVGIAIRKIDLNLFFMSSKFASRACLQHRTFLIIYCGLERKHLRKYNARNGMNLNPYYGIGMENLRCTRTYFEHLYIYKEMHNRRAFTKCACVCSLFKPVCV